MSAAEIQEIAEVGVDDGIICEQLEILARLGCRGKFPSNCERDLKNHLAPTPLRSALKTLSLPMKGIANFIYVI